MLIIDILTISSMLNVFQSFFGFVLRNQLRKVQNITAVFVAFSFALSLFWLFFFLLLYVLSRYLVVFAERNLIK